MNRRAPLREPKALPNWVAFAVMAGTFMDLSAIVNDSVILQRIRAPLLSFAVGLLGLAWHRKAWRPEDMARSKLFKYIGVIVFFALAGVPFAIVSWVALDWIIQNYAKVLLQMVMIWAVCRTKKHRDWMVMTVLAAAVFACVVGLFSPRGDGGRLASSFYDANSLATLANISMPLAAWFFYERKDWLRWAAVPVLPIALLSILIASSRGGFLALAAMAGSTIFLFTNRAPPQLQRLFPVAVVAGILAIPMVPSSVWDRMQSMLDGTDYNFTSETGRIELWKRGMGYAMANPIFGVGVVNFGSAEGLSELGQRRVEEGRGFVQNAAHSSYVEAVAELGFIGGGAFILLVLVTMKDLFLAGRKARSSRDPEGIYVGTLAIAWVGLAVSITFLAYTYYTTPYIFFALAFGHFDALDKNRAPARPRAPARRRRYGAQPPHAHPPHPASAPRIMRPDAPA